MKKLLLFLLLSATICSAQTPIVDWQKSFGGTGEDVPRSVIQTQDGNYIVAGESISTDGDITSNHGNKDAWVLKLDAMGTIIWQKTYGGSAVDVAHSIRQTADGGYVFSGTTFSTDGDVANNSGGGDFWIVKLSAGGAIEWEKTYGGSQTEIGYHLSLTADDGFIITGYTWSFSLDGDVILNHGSSDCWITKLDSLGNLEWQKSLGGSATDLGRHIEPTFDGGYIAAIYSSSSDGDVDTYLGMFDIWIVKLDASGGIVWEKSFGGSDFDSPETILPTADGGYIIGGKTASSDGDVSQNHITTNSSPDFWLIKIDAVGNIIWERTIGGNNSDWALCLEINASNNYVIGGYTRSVDGDILFHHGATDCWLAEVDQLGNMLWNKTFGGSQYDEIISLTNAGNEGYIYTGITYSDDMDVTLNHGNGDFWVVKLVPEPLSSNSFENNIFSIYPNPVDDLLHISVPFKSTDFTLYDLLGQKVFSENLVTRDAVVNLSAIRSGIYFYTINQNSDNAKIGKLIVQ